jgi:hypothetical protein
LLWFHPQCLLWVTKLYTSLNEAPPLKTMVFFFHASNCFKFKQELCATIAPDQGFNLKLFDCPLGSGQDWLNYHNLGIYLHTTGYILLHYVRLNIKQLFSKRRWQFILGMVLAITFNHSYTSHYQKTFTHDETNSR